jgi:phage/plasmid-like protein (TIGR03299 family)
MSHEITNNMMAYKGEKPWHGLGFEVPENATGAEMLDTAKLNWLVQRRNIAMKSADGKSLLVGPLKGWLAIVRADTNDVFQVSSDRYHPVQNKEIVEFFREYCEAGHATMETVGGLKGGAIVWALAKLNGKSTVDIGGVDKVEGRLLLATSHDGTVRTIAKAVQTRVVCWNTLQAAFGENSKQEFRMKHSRKWTPEVAKEAKLVMGMALEQVQRTNELSEAFSKVSIDDKGRWEFVTRLLLKGESLVDQIVADAEPKSHASLVDAMVEAQDANPKDEMSRVGKAIIEAMISSPGSDLVTAHNTLWGAINGVTHYVDHTRGRLQDGRMAGAWFGHGAQIKQKAVEIAASIGGISLK